MITHKDDPNRQFQRYAQVAADGTVVAYTDIVAGEPPPENTVNSYVDVTDSPEMWDVTSIKAPAKKVRRKKKR